MNKHWKYTLKWTAHQQPPTKKCIATYTKHTWTYTSFHTRARFYKRASSFFGHASLIFYRLNKKQTLLGIFDRGANIFLVDFLYNCWSTIVLLRCCGLRCYSSRDCNFLWRYTFLCSTVLYWHACIFRTNVFLFFYTVE